VKILLTGASSFTGLWFARELANLRHTVVATLRSDKETYSGLRQARVDLLNQCAEIVWSCPFGEKKFLEVCKHENVDVLCHHAAETNNYKNEDFNITDAVAKNISNVRTIIDILTSTGLKGVVATGTFFEPGEGAGSDNRRAFSPYGISKHLSYCILEYWCQKVQVPLGKFVIPNPFGPYEEPRFCAHLVREWKAGRVAEVRTPDYIRDNIHVDLLAKAYVSFVNTFGTMPLQRCNPSGYIETQGAFALRFAAEVAPRLGLNAHVKLLTQSDFSEPLIRINTDPVNKEALGWSESTAWDGVANYYRNGSR